MAFIDTSVATAKSHWTAGDDLLLYIENGGVVRTYQSWNSAAKDFWENGAQSTANSFSSSAQLTALVNSTKEHNRVLRSHAQIINSQTASIKSLIAENQRMKAETERLRNLAFTRLWTDLDGNSFMGVFIEYNLGAVKVQKVLDNASYTIPAGRLTPACKEMALALNKFK